MKILNIQNGDVHKPVNETERLIINAMKDNITITYSDLMLQLNKSRTTILRYIKSLK